MSSFQASLKIRQRQTLNNVQVVDLNKMFVACSYLWRRFFRVGSFHRCFASSIVGLLQHSLV